MICQRDRCRIMTAIFFVETSVERGARLMSILIHTRNEKPTRRFIII